jgi:hypothetical protein
MNNWIFEIEYQNLDHSNKHVMMYVMDVMLMNDLFEIVVHFLFLLVVDFPNVYDKDDRMIEFDLYLIDIHILNFYYELM